MDKIDVQALRVAKGTIDAIGGNLSRAAVIGAHKETPVVTMSTNGSLNMTPLRAENPIAQEALRSSLTRADYASVISERLNQLSQCLSKTDKNGHLEHVLSTALSSLISSATISQVLPSAKGDFVTKSQELCSAITVTKNEIARVSFEADRDLAVNARNANMVMKEIFEINQQITNTERAPTDLLDRRDNKINELARYMDISVNYDPKGVATIGGAFGNNATVVSGSHYIQFMHTSLNSANDVLNGQKAQPLEFAYIDGDRISEPYKVDSAILGGTLGGLVTVQAQHLSKISDGVSKLTDVVFDAINAEHSSCSGWPPKSELEGDVVCRRSDQLTCSGTLKISMVGTNGAGIGVNPNDPVRTVTLDLSSIGASGGNRIDQVINALNRTGAALTHNRLALGEIKQPNPVAGGPPTITLPDEYLLNDIQIKGQSDFANGMFSFTFDVDGNKYCGSKVQIVAVETGVTGYGVGTIAGARLDDSQLPKQAFEIKQSEHKTLNTSITVNSLPAAGGDVCVQFRVIGENGQVSEGTARFAVPPILTLGEGRSLIDRRMYGVKAERLAPPAGESSNIVPTSLENTMTNHAGAGGPILGPTSVPFSVDFVDENGAHIPSGSSTAGHLVVKSAGKDVGIIIDDIASKVGDKRFNQYFGLNNLFVKDSIGNIAVKPNIAAHPEELSIGSISQSTSKVSIQKGDKVAISKMQFGGGVPQDGNTVTIGGVAFTFRDVPATLTDVPIDAASLPNTLENLKSAINDNSLVSGLVSAASDGINTITITAKTAGTAANDIIIGWSMNGGRAISFNSIAFFPNASGAANNIGLGIAQYIQLDSYNHVANPNGPPAGTIPGTDKTEAVETISPQFGPNATQFFEAIKALKTKRISTDGNPLITGGMQMPLESYTTSVVSSVGRMMSESKVSADTAKQGFAVLDSDYKKTVGIDPHAMLLKLREAGLYYSALINASMMVSKAYEKAMDRIMA